MADSNRVENASASGAHQRSKMSEEYDEALAQNVVTPDGREGARLNQSDVKGPSSSSGSDPQGATAAANVAPSASAAPGQPSASPAENALSTQADAKMGAGEELRDHDFPVPPQKTTVAAQRVAVDQGLMNEEAPRSGEVVGTLPGDRQNVGETPNVMDQHAMTPDFPSQR